MLNANPFIAVYLTISSYFIIHHNATQNNENRRCGKPHTPSNDGHPTGKEVMPEQLNTDAPNLLQFPLKVGRIFTFRGK